MNNFYFNNLIRSEKKQIRYISNIIGVSLLSLTFVPFILMLFIKIFNISAIVSRVIHINPNVGEPLLILLECFVYSITMFVPFIIIVKSLKFKNSIKNLFIKPKGDTSIYGIFLFLGSTVVGVIAISILISILNSSGFEITSPESYIPKTFIGMFFYFIQIAILPAILEELLFRGAIMQSLRVKGDKFAIILSSLIFAFVHGNFIQIVNAFILGLVIGYFVIKTNSLWLGIIMHFLNNGKAAISVLMLENFGEATTLIFNLCLNIVFIITAIVCFFIYKKYKLHYSGITLIEQKGLLNCSNKISISVFSSALLAVFIINILNSFDYIKFVG